MKKEAVKDYFILNEELISTKNMEIFENINKPYIYEVIRVIEGVPLFLEEHLDRMKKTAKIMDYNIDKTETEIRKDIKKLIQENQVRNSNIKLLCLDLEGKGQVFLTYFIESYHSNDKIYNEGVHTTLYNFGIEDPNTKISDVSFRERVDKKIKNKNAFEAFLVNKDGNITKGSRFDMFFVRGQKVYTVPYEKILLNVTRNHIINICEKINLELIEETIHVEDLYKIDGGFIIGTSINVIPIKSVDEFTYESLSDPIINKIKDMYLKEIKEYIDINKLEWI
ncbi:aminotransferase class IV [Anaerosalibacter bizertensis]|uniref:Aminotransferase class IV n=1 Tax=Anaerosalibacter bizertensis TaxID=932217 RepID=A0A9Q4FLC1_9FIRM|nr:aminotransferase class IV [Anaerosalibacter bizertensis]MBV1818256.1 aminotransferase class IV [Bacteroidales bacterium MSK.15.36]MCB5559407.1 aminotransferase class IV [Anaerosalibacter bizertensis]MCG4564562.1 aminotransferase class IV [Anaerosalibacter bizertensis]MCG4581717.1 aminotransferase class IV [Anaerosalibacter bizertensis]MCG4585359.1 aminotransferase class IV [Anaerosalibacter bizertensis]